MTTVKICGAEGCQPGREVTLRVFLNGQLAGASQGTPTDLEDFGIGYLLSEGLICDRDCLVSVEADDATGVVCVATTETVPEDFTRRWRTSSASLTVPENDQDMRSVHISNLRATLDSPMFKAEDLAAQMSAMEAVSPKHVTGENAHCCALGLPASTTIILMRADLGRHNAMDKLIGHAWREGLPLSECALFITGRISAEMAYKAIRAGIPVLVSLKSATTEAVTLAEREGLTLISHCHNDSLQINAHPTRILA